ncbi:nuclear transport factor 2 family protein [Actinosynnema sp. NPDC023658]|uniref:nuclear transport factor 2 family protein n=1 Tax=Actinosynnema sp. NPDC023658 TaxID=3155465 RepID=UPI0033D35B34
MSDVGDFIARLERIETELALHRLAQHYCVAADHRDLELWREVWTPDGVWATSSDLVFTGLDAICNAVRRQWQAFSAMQHGTVNHVVDLTDAAQGVATGRSDVIVHVQVDRNTWLNGGGTYLDEYRRHDGRWRIAKRTVTRPFDLGPLPAWDTAAT